MSEVTYPFDPTGQDPNCLVVEEYHTLTDVNAAPARIIIPEFAPFYTINLVVEHIDLLGNATPLNEGIDYNLALPYMAATRSVGKGVYGGLPIISNLANGSIRIQYQTVGGPWCADRNYVYARLLETVYNPRMTWWDSLTNVQDFFPPQPHDQSIDDVRQIDVLFQHLVSIRDAILQAPNNTPANYIAHMLEQNPHGITLEYLGAGGGAYLDRATDQEVLSLVNTDKIITLRQAILLFNKLKTM